MSTENKLGDHPKSNCDESNFLIGDDPVKLSRAIKTYHPAKLPFSINRFLLITIIVVYIIFSGTHYFNWPCWQKIFVKTQAFADLCEPGSVLPCLNQITAIASLLPLVTFMQCLFSFLAGLMLDLISPRICSLVGVGLMTVGWLLLFFLQNRTWFVYRFSFALVGAGADPSFFGTLNIANLFPGYSSTAIAVFGAARGLSNLWPLVFEKMLDAFPTFFSMKMISLSFILMYILCMIVVLIFIPYKPYILATSTPKNSPKNLNQDRSFESALKKTRASSDYTFIALKDDCNHAIILPEQSLSIEPFLNSAVSTEVIYADKVPLQSILNDRTDDESDKDSKEFRISKTPTYDDISPSSKKLQKETQTRSKKSTLSFEKKGDRDSFLNKNSRTSYIAFGQSHEDLQKISQLRHQSVAGVTLQADQLFTPPLQRLSVSDHINHQKSKDFSSKSVSNAELKNAVPQNYFKLIFCLIGYQLKTLYKFCFDKRFLLISAYCVVNLMRNNFFLATAVQQLETANNLLVYMNIISFIPGPICGMFVDRFGPLRVIATINLFNIIMLIILLVVEVFNFSYTFSMVLRYLAVIFSFPGIGYLLSQIYTYIAIVFPPEHLGKLAGFCSFLGGLFTMFLGPLMTNYASKTKSCVLMNTLLIILSLFAFGFIYTLHYDEKKEAVSIKATQATTNPVM